MKILSIETSCDETALALLEAQNHLPMPKFSLLADALLSQTDIHAHYGGVYPMLAKREHEKNLPILLEKILHDAHLDPEAPDFDVIAVTNGPGLEPALWTGITFAENLGKKWQKPVIPVNHMKGHLFSVLYHEEKPLVFPAIALLVSGGHTELVLLHNFDTYELIGTTQDDAVGEAFDKVARLLGLSYPGGPKISALAEKHHRGNKTLTLTFPRPMIHTDDYNFSYSGLKTAVLYTVKKIDELTDEKKEEIAHAFEDAAIDVLIEKTKKALEHFGAQTLIVGGGVSANRYLRHRLELLSQGLGVDLRLSPFELTTDNAVMIAIAAFVDIDLHPEILEHKQEISARGNLSF